MKTQVEIRSIKKGSYIIIDDEPCTVVGVEKSKPGKHGTAKARMDCIGIFDGQKRSIVQPVTHKAYTPMVERKLGQVLSVVGDVAQIMDLENYSTFELSISKEAMGKVKEGEELRYIESMGKKKFDIR